MIYSLLVEPLGGQERKERDRLTRGRRGENGVDLLGELHEVLFPDSCTTSGREERGCVGECPDRRRPHEGSSDASSVRAGNSRIVASLLIWPAPRKFAGVAAGSNTSGCSATRRRRARRLLLTST